MKPGSRAALTLLAALALCGCATTRAASPPPAVFDAHAHIEPGNALGRINPHAPGTVQALLEEMDRANVTRALAIVAADRDAAVVTRANDSLHADVAKSNGRLIPVAAIPSDDPAAALAELDRVAKAGFRAVKLTPEHTADAHAALEAQVARAAHLHLVVLLDGWSLDLQDLARIALAHPDARLVVAHLGGIRFSDALVFDVLRRYAFYARNVWFDLSNVAHVYARSPYADQFVWVCRQLGTDRLLFGSDFPLISPEDALQDVTALGFTDAERRQILHDNAAKLFGP